LIAGGFHPLDGLTSGVRHGRTASFRIGSKTLSYWPCRFLSDQDTEDLRVGFDREGLQAGTPDDVESYRTRNWGGLDLNAMPQRRSGPRTS
jgi:hypothetical protein